MSATVRATCPGCQNVIKIPAEWADRAVKCKKCGAVMQGKPRHAGPSPEEVPQAHPEPTAPVGIPAAPMPSAPLPVPQYQPEPAPQPPYPGQYPGFPQPQPQPQPQAQPQPGYGYPPPGYAYPPQGYGPAMPPGYPAMPPGYPQPQPGYPQPGYPYPAPPGYGPPPGYPPGYGMPQPGYAYPGAPGMQPAPAMPAPVTTAPAFNMESSADEMPTVRRKADYRRDTGKTGTFIWIFMALLLTGGLIAGAIILPKFLKKNPGDQNEGKNDTQPTHSNPSNTISQSTQSPSSGKKSSVSAAFPRRMLVMNVTKYLYSNPLADGRAATIRDQFQEAVGQLAYHWQIPRNKDNDQLYTLADTSAKDPRPMLKPIIEKAFKDFCESSRAQDRVVIYFGGHAIEKDGKSYLVPVDGDVADLPTLIPLDDFWAAVNSCKAQQRVVIFDVCRLNEDEDMVRPGSEKMTTALEKALHSAPRGVQVITTCSTDQNALEYRRPPDLDAKDNFAGSLFLGSLKSVANKNRAKAAKAAQDEPIPIGEWLSQAEKRMEEVAKLTGKPVPLPKMSGNPGQVVAFSAEEKPAGRFEFAPMPKGVPLEQLTKITHFIELPLLRGSRVDNAGQATTDEEGIEGSVVFLDDVMKDYKPVTLTPDEIAKEPEKYKIRKVTLEALEVIRKEWKSASGEDGKMTKAGTVGLRTTFAGESNDNVKKLIAEEQETPARIILELEDKAKEMDGLMEQLKTEESKFWQATFLYTLAQIKARLAFMHEYNYALGNIRTDSLPMAEGKKMGRGLQMVSSEKMKSKKDIRDIGDESKKLFAQLADEHKGTPWAVQAKRWKVVALGLEWRPFVEGGKVMDDDDKK